MAREGGDRARQNKKGEGCRKKRRRRKERDGVSGEEGLNTEKDIKGAREDKMFKSDVREEGRGRDLLEERLSQVVPGQSLIRFKSN